MSTADYLNQLEQDREDLVDNLEAKGITGLSGDETFTELVPEVLNIPSGSGGNYSLGEVILTKASTQSGTPSPTNEVPVNTVTSISVTVTDGTNTNTVSIPLNGNEMCGIGNVLDELHIDNNGNCVLYKRVGKKVYTGNETWNKGTVFYSRATTSTGSVPNNANIMCNYFVGNADAVLNNSVYIPGDTTYVWINTDIVNTSYEFQTWLRTHNTVLYFELASTQIIFLGQVQITFYQDSTITNSENANTRVLYIKNS